MPDDEPKKKQTVVEVILEFMMCFVSLQASYLVWGMMQELIMNTDYEPTPLNPSGRFPSATFCVLSNRSLAIIVGAFACWWNHGTVKSSAPLISFTPCALSNTLSSWGQYEALAYVSFSMQTIFKSTKVIPVMFMGYMLKGAKYTSIEYVEAVLITVGVGIFSYSKSNFEQSPSLSRQLIGFGLLSLYVLSDSFTSQWQSRIYKDYGKIDHFQMMYGVNVSAIIITAIALVASGELTLVWDFLQYNPAAIWYNVVTAITSTTGQIAIFYTIRRFGPIVFTVIMLTRQIFSICISNIFFGHTMALQSYIGATIVFGVIGYSSHRKFKAQEEKNKISKQRSDASLSDAETGKPEDEEQLLGKEVELAKLSPGQK